MGIVEFEGKKVFRVATHAPQIDVTWKQMATFFALSLIEKPTYPSRKIYVARVGDSHSSIFKIGVSKNIPKRMKTLKVKYQTEFSLVCEFYGSFSVENALHFLLDEFSVCDKTEIPETFNLVKSQIDWLRGIKCVNGLKLMRFCCANGRSMSIHYKDGERIVSVMKDQTPNKHYLNYVLQV